SGGGAMSRRRDARPATSYSNVAKRLRARAVILETGTSEAERIGAELSEIATELRNGEAAGAPAKLRLLDIARMVLELPPRVPWVVGDLVVEGALTLLSGREGEGKSLLSLALAAGVGRGECVAGMECQAGRVLLLDAENGEWE